MLPPIADGSPLAFKSLDLEIGIEMGFSRTLDEAKC